LDTTSHPDPSGAQITLWHAFTKVEEQTLLVLISEFNSQNEWGITVKPEYGGHYRDLHKKTLAAVAFGSPPEMTFTYHSRVAEYAQADVIQPLDDYIANEEYGLTEEELEDYFPAFLAGDRYPAFDGELLSLSPSLGMEVMYYNVDMLNELGYENPPATWDEFKAMCMEVTGDTDGDGINDTFGYAVSPSGSTFAGWVWNRGGELLSKDGQSVMFQEQGLEALTLLKDLMRRLSPLWVCTVPPWVSSEPRPRSNWLAGSSSSGSPNQNRRPGGPLLRTASQCASRLLRQRR